MDHIILQDVEEVGALLDITLLMSHLEKVEDKRQKRGKRFTFPQLLTLTLLAKLAGEDKPSGIAQWVKLRRRGLARLFQLHKKKVPSLNTLRRALEACDPEQLQRAYLQFLHQVHGGQQSLVVSIDGKAMRGTIPKGQTQGVHLLAAYLPAEGIVLMQIAVDKKENEISAAPRLLSALDLKGRVVCGDAMFTQRALSVQILAQGGDYIWFVKDNQPTLRADVERFFEPVRRVAGWHHPELPQETTHQVDKAHQRIEKRTLILMPDETGYLNWPGVQQVFKIVREAVCLTTGKTRSETVYGITSLTTDKTSAARLLDDIRSYWGIENGLHHRRDVTFYEDALHTSIPKLAETMSVFNNFIIGLARKLGIDNLAFARRLFDASITQAFIPSD